MLLRGLLEGFLSPLCQCVPHDIYSQAKFQNEWNQNFVCLGILYFRLLLCLLSRLLILLCSLRKALTRCQLRRVPVPTYGLRIFRDMTTDNGVAQIHKETNMEERPRGQIKCLVMTLVQGCQIRCFKSRVCLGTPVPAFYFNLCSGTRICFETASKRAFFQLR